MADVDNPKYDYLKNLQTQVQTIQTEMAKKLDKPAVNMESGQVWTSKTATAWKGKLNENVKTYNSALNSLDDEVAAMLSATPRKCSQKEADDWYAQMNSYNRTRRF